ncbi:hypothetical protein [Nitrospira sp. M1]
MAYQLNPISPFQCVRRIAIIGMILACTIVSNIAEVGADDSLNRNEKIVYRSMNGKANIDVGLASWMSQGRSNFNHDASNLSSLLGDPTSALDYKDVWSNIVELNARLVHKKGFSLKGKIGYGAITDGTLIDDDFVSASGATAFGASVSGPHRISRTESDVSDSYVFYLNGDVGLMFYRFAGNKGLVNAVLGFQYWREKYVARSVRQLECTSVGSFCRAVGTASFVGTKAITNTVQWTSMRVGAEGEMTFWDRLTFEGEAIALPLAWLHNEDRHHLRTDLRGNPSFKMTGLGYGFNLEGGVRLRIFEQFFIHGGYRYWWLNVEDGDWENFPASGGGSTANLNEFRTFRHGATFGMSYRF